MDDFSDASSYASTVSDASGASGAAGYAPAAADGSVYLDAMGFASLMQNEHSDGDTEDIPGFLSDDDTDIDEDGGAQVMREHGDDAGMAYAVRGYASESAATDALGFSATSVGFAARGRRAAHSRTRSATFKNRKSNVTTVVRADTGKGEVVTVNGVPGSEGMRTSKMYEEGRRAAEAARRVYEKSGAGAVYQLPPMPWYQHTEDDGLYKRVSPQDTDVVSYVFDARKGTVKRTVVECNSVKDAVKAARRMTNIHARSEDWTPLMGAPPGFEERISTDMEGSVVKDYARGKQPPSPKHGMNSSDGYAAKAASGRAKKDDAVSVSGNSMHALMTLNKATQDSGPVNIMMALSRHRDNTEQSALSLLNRRSSGDGTFFATRQQADDDIKQRAKLASVLATLATALKIYVDRRAARQVNLPNQQRLRSMADAVASVYSTTMSESLQDKAIGKEKAEALARMQAQKVVREQVQSIVDGKYMNDNFRLSVYMTAFEEAVVALKDTAAPNVIESLKFNIRSRMAARGAENASDTELEGGTAAPDAGRPADARARFINTAMSGYMGLMFPALNVLSEIITDNDVDTDDAGARTMTGVIEQYRGFVRDRMTGMVDDDEADKFTAAVGYMVESDAVTTTRISASRNYRFIVNKAREMKTAVEEVFRADGRGYSRAPAAAAGGGDDMGFAAADHGEDGVYPLQHSAVRLTDDGALVAFEKDGKVYRVRAVGLDSYDNMSLNTALRSK